jgi:UDPglucose 6-dehydrogenase
MKYLKMAISSKIAFFGLTHLGLTYLAATSQKGIKTTGFDIDNSKVNRLNNYQTDIKEPKLLSILKKNKVKFSSDLNKIKEYGIVYFAYDVPTNKYLKSDFNFIKEKINELIPHLAKDADLIILSQVKPGFTRKIKWKKEHLYYQIETLIFGDAIKRAIKPERIIIGSYNNKLNSNFKRYLNEFTKKLLVINYESAELGKLSINLFLSASVSMTNTIAEVCEKTSSSWGEIKEILKTDRRIGKFAYLNPGLGLSGGNIERDHINFLKITKSLKIKEKLVTSLIKDSSKRKEWLNNKLKKHQNDIKKNILLFGITYKKNTNSIKNAPSINMINKNTNFTFIGYDNQLTTKLKIKNLNIYHNLDFQIKNVNCCIISREFRNEDLNEIINFINLYKIKYMFDPFGNIDKFKKKYQYYYQLGENNEK